jgi:hypothetical protein
MLPAPFSVQAIVPFADVAPATVYAVFTHTSASAPAFACGEAVTASDFVDTALAQLPFDTVSVKVTVVPASATAGVYVGVNVFAPEVMEPAPFSVHAIVPFE